MTGTPLEERFHLRIERFEHEELQLEIVLPRSSEDLIDEREFEEDERLPYWAELWPAARALAGALLERDSLPDSALELGCGVGLPTLALLARGVDAVATDYYADALAFTRHNAEHNRLPIPRTTLLDWRRPPSNLGRFPLVLAADVLYEARNGGPLLELLPNLLEPGGEVLLSDPGRFQLPRFLEDAADRGWRIDRLPERVEPSPAGNGITIAVQLYRLSK